MFLRFVFLLITRLTARLRLSRRREGWKIPPAPPAHRPATAAAPPPAPDLGGPGPARDPAQHDSQARRHGLWLLVTPDRSCAGTARSSGAAGPSDPSAAGPAGRRPA